MNEKTTRRVLSSVNDISQPPVASLVDEKNRKVTVIAEEHGPDELQEEMTSSSFVDPEENLLSPEQVKEFFTATEEGSIERLDELFDKTSKFEPNMTQYTESLLMAAIRAKQHKVAAYLIDQLPINVDHTAELLEFNTRAKIPIRERALSSRDLAYDEGMMDLVDLIDISGNELKRSTKRFLQRRITTCLEEMHQNYLKRLKERTLRKLTKIEEKETEETPIVNTTDNLNLPSSKPPTPPPPVVDRLCKSFIEETLQNIQTSNDKSIDESGKKYFRFSGYTVRYRIVETNNQVKERSQTIKARPAFPTIPLTTSRLFPSSFSRSRTITTTPNSHCQSLIDINTRIPIRETRTSICRSALHRATPRISSRLSVEDSLDIKPTTRTMGTTPQSVSSKPVYHINKNYSYLPQQQSVVYHEPRPFIPVTLKATAVGLSSDKPFIRD